MHPLKATQVRPFADPILLGYHFRLDKQAGTSTLGGVFGKDLSLLFEVGFGLSWSHRELLRLSSWVRGWWD